MIFYLTYIYFNKKIALQFDSTPLVANQNNYTTKTVNVYTVYYLDNWPKNPLRNFALKNCLFGVINIVKNSDKKCAYSRYEIAFNGEGEWSFGYDLTKNVVIFEFDKSSLCHIGNLKMTF